MMQVYPCRKCGARGKAMLCDVCMRARIHDRREPCKPCAGWGEVLGRYKMRVLCKCRPCAGTGWVGPTVPND